MSNPITIREFIERDSWSILVYVVIGAFMVGYWSWCALAWSIHRATAALRRPLPDLRTLRIRFEPVGSRLVVRITYTQSQDDA